MHDPNVRHDTEERSMRISEKLARYAVTMRYEELPPAVIEAAKSAVLDSLGCVLGATDSLPAQVIGRVASYLGGNQQSTVFGAGVKTSCTNATWWNGTMIRHLDFNDTYDGRDPSHPSGNIATCLALGEALGSSGKDVLTALVLAYEQQLRLVDCAGTPRLWDRGWDHATNMGYASAVAAAKLLGLDEKSTAHALAIVGAHNNVLTELRRGEIGSIKGTAEATAAKLGLESALLAKEGLTGPLDLFEGDYGYGKIVAGGCDWEGIVNEKRTFRIVNVSTKLYPIESMTLGPAEAAMILRKKHALDPKDVKKVTLYLHDYAFKKPSWDPKKLKPKTRETADHSFPYCLAIALLYGDITLDHFTDEVLFDPRVQKMMDKIVLAVDPKLNELYPYSNPGSVTVELESQKVLREEVLFPTGHPKNPIGRTRLLQKFEGLASRTLSPARTRQIIELVDGLEELADIGMLCRAMVR